MTNQEAYPSRSPRPSRVSTFDRLASMPSPQELLRPQETTVLRYSQSSDPLDPPVVIEEMRFTKADSGEIRQATYAPQEQAPQDDARWMSAEEVQAYMQQAEEEALAELQAEIAPPVSRDRRKLSVHYDGPDAKIKLQVSEGADGTKIDRIMGAFTGITRSEPEAFAPVRRIDYGQPERPALPVAPAYYPPEPVYTEAYEVPREPMHIEDEVVYQSQVAQEELRIDNMLDAGASQKREKSNGFIRRHRKGIAGLIAIATAPLWYQSLGNVVYEAAKQGINGEVLNAKDAMTVFTGNEINEEKE